MFTRLLRTVLAVALLSTSAGASRADEVVLLSSLDLSKATQGWGAPQADKSVEGHPITLAGKVYAHGFGTHAAGTIAIDLKGQATFFSATVGVDDEVPVGQGSVEFRVCDPARNVLWTSGVMHRGDAPKSVHVSVIGLSSIVLRVTTGGDGYGQDHADWADAAITMTSGLPETKTISGSDPSIAMSTAPAAPHIHGPSVVGVFTGTPIIWTVPVTGKRPLAFSVKQLPKGVEFDKTRGIFTGSIAIPGDHAVRVSVKNEKGRDTSTVHFVVGNTLTETPPMGWNSYDAYGDNVTEAETLDNATYLKREMQPYGWDTVVVDYRWYDPGAYNNNAPARAGVDLTMDGHGRLLPSPNRFPSAANGAGFRPLADKIHGMGLRFGIHIMRGIPRNAVKANPTIDGAAFHTSDAADTSDTCSWCPDMYGVRGDTAAGQAYYDSLFRLYASWGVDYVKMDDTSVPYHKDEINAVRNAIDKCGRSIVYSLSPGETPIDQGSHVVAHANLWRASADFWDNWGALNNEFDLGDQWRSFVGPGHWADADMLPLGHLSVGSRSVGPDRRTRFTKSEQVTLMSLWCLLPAPLMLGAAMPDNDAWTLALLTNAEVLALDQDTAASPARRVKHGDDIEVWERTLADGSVGVGVFNTDESDGDRVVSLGDLGLSGRYTVRDLWQRKDLGMMPDHLVLHITGHGVALLRLRKRP
ncbi:MAG: NPCBM/NEW2 domain-containing protein [Capsulimonas sp.]|uniref:NPCBM/NEW2 domain-containing protein n=1 Tax=Capsulimonas sp. TaxID=2494211 RepID=UPI003263B026